MSYLKIYLQNVAVKNEGLDIISDFKQYLYQSDFHIGCISNSYQYQMRSTEEGVDADIFDVFGLKWEKYLGEGYFLRGPIIAVRKHLSAHVRREWMIEGEKCIWVTVPSQGCCSRLHVACMDFYTYPDIDFFTETLTSLSKTYRNDKFLVVGRFPLNWFRKEHQLIGTTKSKDIDNSNKLRSSVSQAGLAQFNNLVDEFDCFFNAVFSSIPVTVMDCPHTFAPEEQVLEKALEFRLNIGLSQFCKTTIDATGKNCTNEPSGQREARQGDVNASGDSSAIIERLVHTKWDEITKLLPELISEKFAQTANELKAVQEECDRMSKENESAKSESARIEKIEEHLRTLEERAITHRERSFGQLAKTSSTGIYGTTAGFGSTQGTGISKRTREATGKSPGMAGNSKRTKNQGDSYKDELTRIKMAVIADNHPASTLGADMLVPIMHVLWGMLDTALDPLPKVSLGEMISGVVHFTCEGKGAVKWLCLLNGIPVGDVKLRVVSAKDLPKPVKMTWKSRNIWCVDTPKVLKILQRCNPSLRTAEWKVLPTTVEEGNVRRIVYMDRVSADVIKMKNYSLYSGLDSSSFKLLEDSEGKVGGPSGQKAAVVTPIADPEDPERPQEVPPIEEMVTKQATSSTSSVRTDELLGGPDVLGLTLTPQPEEVTVEEGTAGGH